MNAPELHGYRYVRDLGTGGFSDVMLYEELAPHRLVAIKFARIPQQGLFDEEAWMAEASVMARVEHPNVVPVYATGVSADGRPYIVMAYFPNGTLSDRVRKQVLDVGAALDLGLRLSGALETIHRMGLTHGDVKPPNILFNEYNSPALGDFGTAVQSLEARAVSVPWASPEVLFSGAQPGPHSDVYSLAASIWHSLSGWPPYVVPNGDNSLIELMRRVRDQEIAPMANPSVPPSLERTLRFALAKDPSIRTSTALEFGRSLQAIQAELRLNKTPIVLRETDGDADEQWHPKVGEVDVRADLVASADDDESDDALGRDVLAAHLMGVLNQLARQQASSRSSGGPVVIHVDGRWGAGKSVLVRMVVRRLASRDAWPTPHVANPVVVWIDAWTQSKTAPAWWNIATGIKNAIDGQHSLLSRFLMETWGALSRVLASGPFLWALMAVISTIVFSAHFDLAALGTFLTVATGAAAAALGLARAFIWAAPAVGKLYLSAEGDPMREVNRIVSQLLRRSPRAWRRPNPIVRAIVVGVAWSCTLWAALTLGTILPASSVSLRWATIGPDVWIPACGGLLATFLIALDLQPTLVRPTARDRWVAPALWGAVVILLIVSSRLAALNATALVRHGGLISLLLGAAPTLVGLAVAIWLSRKERDVPRRPVLLVIDDLDRCSADQVYDYLESLHAIAHNGTVRSENGAQLLALVVSDGRWIRSSFDSKYATFSTLGDPARSMAADFTQKLFDHVVVVPELNARQKSGFLGVVTDGTFSAAVVDEVTRITPAPSADGPGSPPDGESGGTQIAHADTGSGSDSLARSFVEARVKQYVAIRAREALSGASEEGAKRKVDHLLLRYADIMPGNPRLIRRVANTWGMLFALNANMEARVSNDTLARAAVFFVRFPTLVDELLSSAEPPTLRPNEPNIESIWWRSDVMEVLRLPHEGILQPRLLGECFGKRYSPLPVREVAHGDTREARDPFEQTIDADAILPEKTVLIHDGGGA